MYQDISTDDAQQKVQERKAIFLGIKQRIWGFLALNRSWLRLPLLHPAVPQ